MNPLFMGGMAGNIIGGYLLGQNQREKQMEAAELEQKKFKLLMESAKIRDAQEERKLRAEELKLQKEADAKAYWEAALGDVLPKPASEAPATGSTGGLQFSPSFGADPSAPPKPQPGAKLIEILSDPLKAFAFGKMTGQDLMPAHNAMRQASQLHLDAARYGRDESQGTWVDMPTGDGGTRKVWQPRFGGPAAGGGGGGYQPPRLDFQPRITPEGQKGQVPVNPFTGREAGPVQVVGEKEPMSGEAAGRAGMITSSIDSIMQAKAILMPGGELRPDWKKIAFAAGTPADALIPEAREFNSHIENALAAKLRLETGANMPASEKKNLDSRFKPSSLDSPKLVVSKMDGLEQFLRGSIEMLDPNKKYSKDSIKFTATDGKKYAWEPGQSGQTLPPAAVKSLKEGVVTQFGNGQRWTLRNGQPVPVQ